MLLSLPVSRGETLDLPLVCLCFCPGFDILNCLCDFEERHKNVNPRPGKGGGGRCLQGNLWYSPPPAGMTSPLALVTLKMASKVFIEETDRNFDFVTEILFRFLEFGDFKVSIVIEN